MLLMRNRMLLAKEPRGTQVAYKHKDGELLAVNDDVRY